MNTQSASRKKVILLIALMIFVFAIAFVGFTFPYVLKFGQLETGIMLFFGILAILVTIEIIIIKIAQKKGEKPAIPLVSLIACSILFIIGCIKTAAIIALSYSDIPYVHANAFVMKYTQTRRSTKYKLLFADHQDISKKEIRMRAQIPAERNDCLEMAYRENALVIEVRPIKNLGSSTPQECFAH